MVASDELKSLLDKVHDGVTTFDFDGKKVSCILFDENKFDDMLRKVAGQPLSINTDLNILQDGMGHVFVEVMLSFSKGGFVEKILVNANESLDFFELLAETSIIALSSPKSQLGSDNVLMIQLPHPDKAANALEIIQKGLASASS